MTATEGGFVPAADVLDGAPMAAQQAPAPAVAAAAAVVEVPANPLAANGPMRWNNNTFRFVLRRIAQMLNDGTRPDKVFKDKDVTFVAKCLKDYSGDVVSPTQVYNHLRKWRQKWTRVCKLKDLSAALWDNDVHAIMLDQDHYLGHCKVVEG
jgi:hypothetical protein